jgi:diguanylate cyclase (GGDEF)-like protein
VPPEAPIVESYRRLADVFHEVLAEQSLDALLERIADTLRELVPYEDLVVYEADNPTRQLIPVLARSEWAEEITNSSTSFGEGITGWAVEHREPVWTNAAHLDPRVVIIPGTPVDPEALIVVPLIARGALKGALNIYRIGDDATFNEDEFELAKRFGDAAALALDNAQIRARLEHQAQTDAMTGLYNHRYFHERLRTELQRASRAHEPVGVLMLDIDDFKRANDVYGHAIGDEILAQLADSLRSTARGSDIVCRLGGEEFAVIMPATDSMNAERLAIRIQERIALQEFGPSGRLTLSMGLSEGPAHAGHDDREGAWQEPVRPFRRRRA